MESRGFSVSVRIDCKMESTSPERVICVCTAYASGENGSNIIYALEHRIKAADPRNILTRGYSLVTDEKGVVVNSVAKLKKGHRLNILFADGSVKVEIIE